MNLSSCQGRTGHCGWSVPRTQVAQQKSPPGHCRREQYLADWAASRQAFGGQMGRCTKLKHKDKERVMKNINIMGTPCPNRLFDRNKELKELVMTLTGTLECREQ